MTLAGFFSALFGAKSSARSLQLQPFVDRNKPAKDAQLVAAAKIDAYRGRLPNALLELWGAHGFGFYGEQQLALIDPDIWQPILDSWIVSPPSEIVRTPIALTPFNGLLYYRKLTPTVEDVALVDPLTSSNQVLSYSLVDFFNTTAPDEAVAAALLQINYLDVARRENGALAWGEVYEVDQVLLPMQMLKIRKVDALEMHRRLREEVAIRIGEKQVEQPKTIGEAIPAAYRGRFTQPDAAGPDGQAGLYFSSYVDQHRLLRLDGAGNYHLLFWSTDPLPRRRYEPRLYFGAYWTERVQGDAVIQLHMENKDEAPSSDAWEESLIFFVSGGQTYLMQETSAAGAGGNFSWDGSLRNPDEYFLLRTLNSQLPTNSNEVVKLPYKDLPAAIRRHVIEPPLVATIINVSKDDDDSSYRAQIDKGESSGIQKNIRLGSPAGAGKELFGWAWDIEQSTCWVGLSENIKDVPVVGDQLTTRSPTSDPF